MADPFERLRAYQRASPEERAEMIRASYAAQEDARRRSIDLVYGEGSFDARRAANRAVGMPAPREIAPALARPWERLGYWEYGR